MFKFNKIFRGIEKDKCLMLVKSSTKADSLLSVDEVWKINKYTVVEDIKEF